MTQEARAWLARKRDELKGEVHALTGQLIAIEGLIAAFDAENRQQILTPPDTLLPRVAKPRAAKTVPAPIPRGALPIAIRDALQSSGPKGMRNRDVRMACERLGLNAKGSVIGMYLFKETQRGRATYNRSTKLFHAVNGA